MAMCKECKAVVGPSENVNGICKTCIEKGVSVPDIVNSDDTNVYAGTESRDFGNPFSFKGKSGRLDFLVMSLGYLAVIFAFSFISAAAEQPLLMIIGVFIALPISLAAMVRRSRDLGQSPLLMIIASLIPVVTIIPTVMFLFVGGKEIAPARNRVRKATLPEEA